MDILFLSHCVPNPPDKGEKIRAFHELIALSKRYRIHLACFARSAEDIRHAHELKEYCASIYAEPFTPRRALTGAALRFACGGCLTTSYYGSRRMRRYIQSLKSFPLAATVSYSSAMVQYAPSHLPLWLDIVDVDSEKWFQYAGTRWPGLLYKIEGRRLRALESKYVERAECTLASSPLEQKLLLEIAPQAKIVSVTNGVDFEYFDPSLSRERPRPSNRRFVAFVGSMDYYPNVDACCWFVECIFGPLRRRFPDLEFLIVGRNPSRAVLKLGKLDGVVVTGGVPDVRPYLAFAHAVVAPLRIARGVQNKILEALAMGKHVCASAAVSNTFGGIPPTGLEVCNSTRDYIEELTRFLQVPCSWNPALREGARRRFSWQNFQSITDQLAASKGETTVVSR